MNLKCDLCNLNLSKENLYCLFGLKKNSSTSNLIKPEKSQALKELSKKILHIVDQRLEKFKNKETPSEIEAYLPLVDFYIITGLDLELVSLAKKHPPLYALMKSVWLKKESSSNNENRQIIENEFSDYHHYNHFMAYFQQIKYEFQNLSFLGGWNVEFNDFEASGLYSTVYFKMCKDYNKAPSLSIKNKTDHFFSYFCEEIFNFNNIIKSEFDSTLIQRLEKLQKTNQEFKEVIDIFTEQLKKHTARINRINRYWNSVVRELGFFLKTVPEGNPTGFDLLITQQNRQNALVLLMHQKRNKLFSKNITIMIIKRLIDTQ